MLAGLPLRGLAFGTPLMIWATATAATTRTTAPTAAPTKTRRTSLPFRSVKRPGGFVQRAGGPSGCRSVNNGAMHFDLPDDDRLLQQTVRDFAVQEVAPVAEELDREKRFPYEIVAKMGELGWMGIPFPEEVGGAGGTTLQYAIAVEELTRADSSVAITMCAHTSLGTQPIYLLGSDDQKERLLPDLCAGRKLGAFGLTEPEAGSDAGNVKTRATLDGDGGWVVDGAKQFIT